MTEMKNNESVERLLHDLRAPLVNVDGFAGELNEAVGNLGDLVRQFESALPVEFHSRVVMLMERDLGPCLDMLRSSVEKLDGQIDRFAHSAGANHTGKPQGVN